jgi:enterochelin esterase-like enzyme
VNRDNELFTSWAQLFGQAPSADPAADTLAAPPPAPSPARAHTAKVTTTVGSGRITSIMVYGRASGITMPTYVYLPPGYDSPQWAHRRFPVLEAFDGAPGSPTTWIKGLYMPTYLDREIDSGRMAPTVVVLPYQTSPGHLDSECVNAVGGPAIDTFLTTDVPDAIEHNFRVRSDSGAWATIGYSAGAFCAVNLAMRHPDRYAAAVSMSGYFTAYEDSTTGQLFGGSATAFNLNSPLWRLQHLPAPRLALYLAAAQDDTGVVAGLNGFVAAVRSPLSVTVVEPPVGGHSMALWRHLLAPAFDWISAHLAGPV